MLIRCLYFLLLLTISPLCRAQPSVSLSASSPQAALNVAFEKGNLMVALSGVEWRPGLNLAAAHLETGSSISLNLNLEMGIGYVFIASQAGYLGDVDLFLRDQEGTILQEDREEDSTPVVEFTAQKSGVYQLQIHLVSSQYPREFIALSILQSGGLPIPEQEYQRVAGTFFGSAEKILSAYEGTAWQRQPAQWCTFGFVLAENQGATLHKLRPEAGKLIFAATGSPNLRNIDLYLANENQRILAKDNGPEANPLIFYDCPADATLDLRVEVERSNKSALLLVGVFEQ